MVFRLSIKRYGSLCEQNIRVFFHFHLIVDFGNSEKSIKYPGIENGGLQNERWNQINWANIYYTNLDNGSKRLSQNSLISQEKILCSLVLKLKVFISKYLQEHYIQCITRAALFLKNVPGTFFNATHRVKAIAI